VIYYDPHPTNCVSIGHCPAGSCRGYPRFTRVCGPEVGYHNLAVFYGACGLDCLFCQNWEHKEMSVRGRPSFTVDDLVAAAGRRSVTCVCYFGGDPAPWSPHAIRASREILRRAGEEGRIMRICWETNGIASGEVFREWVRLSAESGGNVKVDFKAWTPSVYRALTGVDARDHVLKNLRAAADAHSERGDPPLLTVSVLLVPGYVGPEEVRMIAREVARLDRTIPMVLLAFKPDHRLRDLPTTSRRHASEALRAAREEGVKEVRLGNEWLLCDLY